MSKSDQNIIQMLSQLKLKQKNWLRDENLDEIYMQ